MKKWGSGGEPREDRPGTPWAEGLVANVVIMAVFAYDEAMSDERKIVRGVSWSDRPFRATSASRQGYRPWQRVYNVGFRVIIDPHP